MNFKKIAHVMTFIFRQRMKARAFCLGVRGFTRRVIGQPLAFDAFERFGGAFCIFTSEAGTVVVTEIELGDIAV